MKQAGTYQCTVSNARVTNGPSPGQTGPNGKSSSSTIRDIKGESEDWRVSISCGDEREFHRGVCIRTIYTRVIYILILLLPELNQ